MINLSWKVLAPLSAVAAGALIYVDLAVIGPIDTYMRNLVSEVKAPEGRGIFDRPVRSHVGASETLASVHPTAAAIEMPTTRAVSPRVPAPCVSGEPLALEGYPRNAGVREVTSTTSVTAAAGTLLPKAPPIVHPIFTGSRRSTDNLATNEASGLHTLPITYERFAIDVSQTDPVIPLTGEFVFSQPLFTLPGNGLPLSVGLSYRSGYTYNGPVGMNWEHNWNARIKEGTPATHDGDLDLYGHGRVDHYTESGTADVFTMPVGSFEKSVTRYPSRTPAAVERLLQDGTLETYENLNNAAEPGWYFLTSVKHRDRDNAITLAYDSAAKLTSITDTRGKAITFSYDNSHRVTKVSDWSSAGGSADRYWTLAYDSNDDLTRVSAPLIGGVIRNTEFTYDTSDRMLSVKAPREVASSGAAYLQMEYDGSGRVTKQIFGDSSTQKYVVTYAMNKTTEIDREGARRIFEFDSNYAITKIKQERSPESFEDTTCYWDSSTGLLTKSVAPEGNGMLYQYSGGLLTASIKSTASGLSATSIATMRSGSDHLVTEYVYQTTSDWKLLTKVIDPNGRDFEITRDGNGNVTSQKSPETGASGYSITYDSLSRPITVTDPESKVVAFTYTGGGQVSKVTVDPSGLAIETTFARDQYGNVTSITDPTSGTTTISRNALGYPTSVTSPTGKVTDYFYDLNDRVTETRRDHGNADISNSEQRILTSYTLLDEVSAITMQYGSSYGSNRIWAFARDREDRVTSVTLPRGNSKTTTFDMRGLEVTKTVASGTAYASSSVREYDQNHRLTKMQDGKGNATTLAYDGFDRTTKMTDPGSHYATTTFDKNSNAVTRQRYNSGNTKLIESRASYDGDNRVTSTAQWAKKADLSTDIESGTVTFTMSYDKSGRLTQTTDSCGCGGGASTTTYTFDGAGRRSKVTDALGNSVTSQLDPSGRVTKTTADEVEGGTTKTYVVEHAYDVDGHLTSTSERGGGSATALTTTYDVDGFGRVRTATDPNGNVVANLYDDFGRVTKVRRRLTGGGSPTYLDTVMVYDLNDNLVTRTNVRGSGDTSCRYEYDQADRLTLSYDEAGSDTVSLTYDQAHNVSTRTDRNGSSATYTYDSRNLLLTKSYSLATNVVGPTLVKFLYDGVGRLTSAYNQDSLVTRTWNTLGKLESETTWITPTDDSGSGTTYRKVEYTYGGDGLLSLVKYPDGLTGVKRTYDSLNRVSKLERTDDITAGSPTYVVAADWDFAGPRRMTKLTLGSDRSRETLAYDAYGRATQLTWDRLKDGTRTTTVDLKRGYDAGGRVTFERRDYINASTGATLGGVLDYGDRYYYDGANRLTKTLYGVGYATSSHSAVESATESTTDFAYRRQFTLDEVGNRKTLQYDTPSQSGVRREDHVFDTQNQLGTRTVYDWNGSTLTQTSQETNTFDTNGNQKTSPTVKVDMENRIYEATDGSGHVWRYRYDPFGRRIERKDTNGSFWTHTYYDGEQPIEEFVVQAGSSPLSESRVKFVRVYGPYLMDQILWARADIFNAGPSYYYEGYYQGDFLGTVQCVVSNLTNTITIEGGVLETYRYTDYGQVQFCDGTGTYYSPNMSQGEQDFTYTGREWNQEIGLYYYRARWYRPETGGFLERDPILDASGVYGYGYVDGMPTDQIDPAGFQALRPTPYQKNKESRSSLRAFACRPTCVDAKKVCEANGGSFDTECCSEFERSCLDAVDDAWDKWREKAGPLERLLDEGRFVKGTERQILLGMAEMAAGAGVLVKGAGVALGSVAVSIVVVVGSTATTGGAGTIIGVGVAVEISVGGVALGAAEVAGGSVGVVDGWTRFMGSDDHYEVLSSSDARATLEKYAAAQSEAAKNLKKAKDGYAPEKCCRKRKPLIPEVEHSPVDVKPAPGSRPVIPADSRPKKLGH